MPTAYSIISGVAPDGTPTNLLVDAQGRQLVVPGASTVWLVQQSDDTPVTGPAALSAINTDLLTGSVNGWYEAKSFQSASVQIIASAGISAGAIIFEQTNDSSLAPSGVALMAYEASSINSNPVVAAVAIAASTARVFTIPIKSRYVRVRISIGFTGGTVQAVATFSQRAASYPVVNVQQAAAANLAVTASVTGATLGAGAAAIGDTGVQYRTNATGAATAFALMSPATPAATAVKTSAGRLLGGVLQNSSASVRSVKFWNTAVAGVTLGTTAALFEIDVPSGGFLPFRLEGGIGFATAITVAVTGAKGLTDNTAIALNDVTGALFYA